jgi:hypothetical protein
MWDAIEKKNSKKNKTKQSIINRIRIILEAKIDSKYGIKV